MTQQQKKTSKKDSAKLLTKVSAKSSATASTVRSMTGFGRAVSGEVECEAKSLNSRFLELSVRLPNGFGESEILLRELASKILVRGKVEISILLRQKRKLREVSFDEKRFQQVSELYQSIHAKNRKSKLTDNERFLLVQSVLARADVISEVDVPVDLSLLENDIQNAADGALRDLVTMKLREGVALITEVSQRIAKIGIMTTSLEKRAIEVRKKIELQYTKKLEALVTDDEMERRRISVEKVSVLDRSDVTEELVRLRSHLAQFNSALKEHPAGRRLEFLLQECGREINTLGNKVADAEAQQLVVEAKVDLEKIREQVQNLE